MLATADIFLFEGFRLDRREGLSRQDECGVFVPLPIGRRALDVLLVLIEHPGELSLRIGIVHLLQSRTAEAIPWLEKARGTIPTFPLAYSFLAAAYALNGEPERGTVELAETYRLSGKVRVSTIADMKVTGYWGPPRIRALYESVYFTGLRKLGVPEE